jgi:hypothetical protein
MTYDLLADALHPDSFRLDYAFNFNGTYSVKYLHQLIYVLEPGQVAQPYSAPLWDSGLSLARWSRPCPSLNNFSTAGFANFAQAAVWQHLLNQPAFISDNSARLLGLGQNFGSLLALSCKLRFAPCVASVS